MTTVQPVTLRLVVDDSLLGGEALRVPRPVAWGLGVTRWEPNRQVGGAAGITVTITGSGATITSIAPAALLLKLRPGCTAELRVDAREDRFSLVHVCGPHDVAEHPEPQAHREHPEPEPVGEHPEPETDPEPDPEPEPEAVGDHPDAEPAAAPSSISWATR
ncbi:MAG: hypothetical protein JWQ19_1330 [Subtercola sp.]|nr:hypothetical protein [Subtercola sp.]